MRGYWIDEITRRYPSQLPDDNGVHVYLRSDNNTHAYHECSESEPIPFFKDRTVELTQFQDDIQSYDLKRMLNALNDGPKPDVQCPWGCSEFYFKAGQCNLALLIQNHLREVVLNFPVSSWYQEICFVETSRWDYINRNGTCAMVLLNKDWLVWPSVLLYDDAGLVALVCRYHNTHDCTKRLYTHVPRKPYHNLSAEKSDQLSHCILQSRTTQIMRQGKFNTVPMMSVQNVNYSGIDSMDVKTEGKFTSISPMLCFHETLSIAGRPDINSLLAKNEKEGILLNDFADNLRARSKEYYPEGSLDKYGQGTSFIPVDDAVGLQLDISGDHTINAITQRNLPNNGGIVEDEISCPRSWSPMINYVQIEDSSGYGYPMKPIDKYYNISKHLPSMMTWALAGSITGCKELWKAIDKRQGPFRFDGWEGYMLTHLTSRYMTHLSGSKARSRSPFKANSRTKSAITIIKKVVPFMPEEMRISDETQEGSNRCFFERFNIEY